MNIRNYIKKIISSDSKKNLLTVTALLVFFNSTCLYFTTKAIEKNTKGSVFSLLSDNHNPEIESSESNQKKMSVELELFQYILRYSKLKHDVAFELAGEIVDNCEKYDVNPYLVLAVIKVESNFKPKAVSNMGAVGLMQLMPSTAKYIANKYEFRFTGRNSLFDPATNVRLGVAYLSLLDQRYNNMEHALWAYNYGPGRYQSHKKSLGGNLPYYVKQVMSFKDVLESESVLVSES